MSRETDTPSSGPNGRGGAAYPSGTPPYGTPMASDGGTDAGRSAAQPEERKTETTLTTRIRINIPGSRPIPPVVVRKPVTEADTAEPDTGEQQRPPAAAGTSTATAEPAPEPEPAAEEKTTSDWFAPRKSPTAKAPQSTAPANGTAPSGASAPAAGPAAAPPKPAGPAAAPPKPPAGSGGPAGTPSGPGAARPGGVVGAMKAPGAGRSVPGPTGGPVAPGHGGGTGSFDVTEALAAASRPGGHPGEPSRDDLPYFAENGGDPGPGEHSGFDGPGDPDGARPRGPQGPSGPTGGPVTGDGPMVPPAGGVSSGPRVPGGTGTDPFADGPDASPFPGAPSGISSGPGVPVNTGISSGPGVPGAAHHPGGGLSDDTAILTPQTPAPEPPPGSFAAPHDNVSGNTVTSGIPVVPPGRADIGPFDGPGPSAPAPAAAAPKPAPKSSAPAPKKKGRSKLVLLGGGVFLLLVGAYGAGLLMNHSDVPKGTTVLGVDIGGGTRDDAIKKLDAAFGGRIDQPLKLNVGGRTVTLKPDQAGLHFDEDATVGKAAGSDYNPVSVIGSLFGQHREVEPEMPVDEEKLQVALENAAGGASSGSDGTIRFVSGKAVAVYGKPYKGIDVARSKQAVAQAYRTQVATGASSPVTVPTTTRQPTVSNAEVDRMMKEFAEPAMSAKVTVTTDQGKQISFSPEKSLWKFLRVKAVDGKLVDAPDEAALKELYGNTFDGVLITRADGRKTPVTVQDVYGALRTALKSTTNRVAVIDTNPS
ncbi:hypothetical protein ABZ202_00785 [Streptomyces sp. NPDC006186]|uniref:hypothetical protein n=1 Tax=Streptomyces sp. NPDC006186 TaxID=3155248 RepID=UPI0033A5C7A6